MYAIICGKKTIKINERINEATEIYSQQSTYTFSMSFLLLLYEILTAPLSFFLNNSNSNR